MDELLGDRTGAVVWEGNPFVGLEAFSFEQERIFRGRERETCEAAERLRAQAAKGCAFLLILGASGSGKSSLARAGLLPALCLHEVDESVAQWRNAVFLPSLHDGDLLLALVRTLAAALPELVEVAPAGLAQLAEDLQANPTTIVANNLALAFAAAGKTAKGPVRLVLLVDQLEEAFTDGGITASQRESFFAALAALARSGQVWVIATLRSDFYAQAQESPALREARGDGGTYDLAAVDQAALRRIIVAPAAMAGVRFENETEDQKTGLEERILNEALAHAEALPHLEYLLQELFERRDQSTHLLTHAAYDELGGVDGVLGRRAATTFAQIQHQLGEEQAAQAFDRLMRSLVTVQPEGRSKAARRRAPLAPILADSAMNSLCQALVSARLLATDRGPGDAPLVTIAHEALFTSWNRISDWIEDNLDFLKERARVEAATQAWTESEQNGDYLLADGLPLARARDLLQRHSSDLGPLERTFINASIEQAEARRKAELRKLRTRNLIYAGLACCAFVAAGLAGWQWQEAAGERDRANVARGQAEQLIEELTFDMRDKLASVGRLDLMQSLVDALERYHQARDQAEEQGLEQRSDEELRRRSVNYNNLGDFMTAVGKLPDAEQHFRKALEISETLAKRDPNNAGWQRDLSVSFERLGDFMTAVGKLPDAEQHFRKALEISETLAKRDPNNADWQRVLSISHNKLGDFMTAVGKLPDAEQHFRKALEIRETLAKRDPNNARWQRALAVSYYKLATVFEAKKKAIQAVEWYQKAYTQLKGMKERGIMQPADEQYLEMLRQKVAGIAPKK